jgi:Xaa-Pro dipeptidase
MTQSRLDKLNASLQTSGLDAVILNPGPTLTHLTGLHFHLMERPVVLMFARDREPAIVLPELELQKVASLPYKLQVFPYSENPAEWEDVFRKATQSLDLDGKRIGVEPRQLRLLEFRYVKAGAPEADFPDASDVLSALRLRKEQAEVESMRRAVKIAQDALEATLPLIRIGMTEKELASELVVQLLKHGSDAEMPFAPIVSGGANAANPHASPSERKLQAGDLLVVDWGAAYAGYISDLTRTFAVGKVDEEYREIHRIVQEANAAGRAAARQTLGMACTLPIAQGTVSAWKAMKNHTCAVITCSCSSPGWRSLWNQESICRTGTECASKIMWSSQTLAQMCYLTCHGRLG